MAEHFNSAQAIAPGIRSLPGRGKAFASTQAAWRFYYNPSVTLQKLAQPLLDCARHCVAYECAQFALVVHDWTDLHYSTHSSKLDRIKLGRDFGYKLYTSLLLSDRSGLPLAPVSLSLWNEGVLTTQSADPIADIAQLDALINVFEFLDSHQWGKPIVHIIDREADSVIHLSQWDSSQHHFVVRGKDQPSVIHERRRQRLIDVAQQLELKNGGSVDVGPAMERALAYREQAALCQGCDIQRRSLAGSYRSYTAGDGGAKERGHLIDEIIRSEQHSGGL